MAGENNLQALLKNMQPQLQADEYVFCTAQEDQYSPDQMYASRMVFREAEGVTLIIKKRLAPTLIAKSDPEWAMITLNIHSDLAAVGFLAAITNKLAEAGISVNPVSAFYHDHLFVPFEKREQAMEVLWSFCSAS